MIVLKWLCFALICLDTARCTIKRTEDMDSVAFLIGLLIGIVCRVFALYGTLTCWLFA